MIIIRLVNEKNIRGDKIGMQEKILENKRLQYIDIAKGIAMICIILGHMGNANINRVVFTFHVPIFFFITGYFISDKCEVNIFVRNKVRTLIIPYIITCFAIVIIATLQGSICGDAIVEIKKWSYASVYGAGDSYTNPFYIPGIGAIWFLLATFWGSIFLRISLNFNKYIRLFSIAAIFAIGYYSRKLFWFPLSIQAGACATLFMYMGNLLNLTKDIIKERNITCLMVTHNMHQALELGNRTLMMDTGHIVFDVKGEERAKLTVDDLLRKFKTMQEKVLTMTVFYYQVPKMSEVVKNVENISKKGVIYRILSLKKKLFFGKINYMFYLG